MIFDGLMQRRSFLQRVGGFATVAAGCEGSLCGRQLRAARIVPGRVPDPIPGNLEMNWADEAMIQHAAELHPFDLQARMNLAVNARTTCVDPNLGYIGYSLIYLETRPPYMRHQIGDFADDTGRHTDSLWLNRSATDDHNNDEVVHRLAQNAMDMVDQGIAWNPPEPPFSWTRDPKERMNYRFAHLPEVSRVILGLMSYYRATGDPRALHTVRSMVRKHYEIAQKNDRYLWYPDYNYLLVNGATLPMRVVRGKWGIYPTGQIAGRINLEDPKASGTGDMGGNSPAAAMGMMLLPVVRYYEDSKDPLAAELAVKFSRLIVELMPQFAENIAQTHSNLATISGVLHTGHVLGIPEFVEWAEDVYGKFIRSSAALDFGWTPEYISQPKGRLICEPCTTVDFLELALQLAQHRDLKYWDHAERIAMNQLLEAQMLRVDFLDKIPASKTKPLPQLDSKWFSTEHVMNRLLGCFGRPAPNDWVYFNGENIVIGQCCFGSGPRGLYDVWYHASQEGVDTVTVNLQFSKRLPSAVITSYMPGRAMLEIEITQAKKLRIRKPGWANIEKTNILVAGKKYRVQLVGGYLELGRLQGGTKVRVEFPDRVERKTERIGEIEFQTTWRGNAVVGIEPSGEIYPLYQGRATQEGVTPLTFVNPHPIDPL